MFSNQRQELTDIFLYYDSSKLSLYYYRKGIEESKVIDNNYIGYTRKELIASFQSPKLGRNYDIATITLIANRIYANIPLKSA